MKMLCPISAIRRLPVSLLFFFIFCYVEAADPEISLSSPEDSFVNAMEGFGTDLQCFVNSCLPPGETIKWYHDDKLIAENQAISRNSSRMSIRHTVDLDKRKVCSSKCSSNRQCQVGFWCVDNYCCPCVKEEFTLELYNVSSSDSGAYECKLDEKNSVEFQLNVLEGGLPPSFSENITFNYTRCCESKGINDQCRSICNPKSMVAQKYDPFSCQREFGKLLQCASNNGNMSHVHCCRLQLVPQFCWEFCSGTQTNFERANRLCVYWMPEIFQCYEQVYLPLPGHPEQLSVNVVNSTALEACWQPPRIRPESVKFYTVRFQEIPRLPIFGGFSGDESEEADYLDAMPPLPHDHGSPSEMTTTAAPGPRRHRRQVIIMTHNLDTNETDIREYHPVEINTTNTCATIDGLKPLTQYTVVVRATNDYGISLPSIKASAVTSDVEYSNGSLPDVKQCCANEGVEEACASKMCDVTQPPGAFSAFNLALTCRNEFPKVAPCLADGRDHTECCLAKNVGSECLKLCNGSSSHLSVTGVLCLSLDLNSIYSCLKQGYETHPSPPTDLIVAKVTASSALIRWSSPKDNSEKVISYSLFYREEGDDDEYKEIHNVTSPYELHGLMPDELHSVYAIAYTPTGKSLKSTVSFFYTGERAIDNICAYGQPLRDNYGQPVICSRRNPCPDMFECVDSENDDEDAFYCCPTKPFVEPEHHKEYNATTCCASKGITGKCLKLCSYDATTDDHLSNGRSCFEHADAWVECMGDSRDNRPCCETRNVPKPCTDLCYASVDVHEYSEEHASCVKFVQQISKCGQEGIYSLPGPPRYLRRLIDGPTWSTMRWDKPLQQVMVNYYEVQFMNGSQAVLMNTSGLSVSLEDLKPGVEYSVKVRSINSRGASVFTSNYSFNLDEEPFDPVFPDEYPIPPSEVTVQWYRDRKANLTWTWIPVMADSDVPILHHEFNVSYGESLANGSRVNWKSLITKDYYIVLENLKENATYDVYVAAKDLDKKIGGIPGPVVSFSARMARTAPWAEIETIPDGPYDIGETLELACIAGGDPVPNVTLEGFGRRLASGFGMAQTPIQISSVDDANTDIMCTAENGHFVPGRAIYSLKVRYPPRVTAFIDPVHIIQDLPARLICRVRGYPTPDITWYYQNESGKQGKRMPKEILPTEKFDIDVGVDQMDNTFNASLTVLQAESKNEGYYYCKACNDLGCSNASIKLIVDSYPVPAGPDYIMDCCKKQKVRSDCLSACTVDIDIKVYETNLHCVDEFPKLMSCSEDGMDHSDCCVRHGVPDNCLSYCDRRLTTESAAPLKMDSCSGYAGDIVTCVESGHRLVPLAPSNLRVRAINSHILNVSWDPSDRQDGSVPMYVVYFKHQAAVRYSTARTESAWLLLSGISPDAEYNVTVIAANQYGFSMFAPPLTVRVGSMESGLIHHGRSAAGTAIAVVFFLFLISAIVMLAVYFTRRPQRWSELLQKLRGSWQHPTRHTDGAVAFENPGYDKEAQVHVLPSNGVNGTGTSAGGPASTSSVNGSTWERAELETPEATVSQTQRGMRYTQFS